MNHHFKRAIVTGGAGFIGSHLVTSLLEEGLEVISIDDYSGGKTENLAHLHNNPRFTEINCDIVNIDVLRPHFEGVDIVFHQACSKNTVCMRDPARDLDVNAKGTLNMLQLARDAKVKKFIHASTGSVYGEAVLFPTDEQHPLNPVSFYGVSKLAGEKYARLFNHLYGMNVTILRYYHVFGPRQEYSDVGGVVSIFANKVLHDEPITIYGDGTQVRSFTYVEDIVAINKFMATAENTAGQAYNCASAIQVTIQELAEKVREHFGKPSHEIIYKDWKPGDIKKFIVSNNKIKDLGYDFVHGFETGLSKTLAWTEQYFKTKHEALEA